MGVSWVINISMDEAKSAQQVVDNLTQRILALGAVKSGGVHLVDCEVFQSQVPGTAATLCYLMHNYEYPVTIFGILDTGASITADNMMELLILKMKSMYEQKTNLKIECKGFKYELDDFVLKISTAVIATNNSVLGVLFEVEYLPVSLTSSCSGLMKEFTQGVLGRSVDIPNHLKLHTAELYTPFDTMHQYLEHFNAFKKSQTPAAQSTS